MALEFRINQSVAGQVFVNTLNVTGSDAIPANADAIATALVACWTPTLLGRITDTWQINTVTFREYPTTTGAPFLRANVATLPLAGTSGALTILATHTAVRCNILNNVAPPYAGCFFLGGFDGAQITTSGAFGPGTLTAVASLADAMLDLGTATGLDVALGIRSQGTPTLPANTTSVVTQIEVVSAPASLDSRRLNQGI